MSGFALDALLKTSVTKNFKCLRKETLYLNQANSCRTHCVKSVPIFSGPYFPVFALNMERYGVSLRIQFECGEIRTRKNSVFGEFSSSVSYD